MDNPSKQRSLAGKTLFITGASRGIGLEVAKRAARDGANVVIVATCATPATVSTTTCVFRANAIVGTSVSVVAP